MSARFRVLGAVAGLALCSGSDLLARGDKFLVAGRGTRYQRPKNARAARFDVVPVANTVTSAVQKLLTGRDRPVMVSLCVKPAKGEAAAQGSCAVRAPAKESSLLEAIDRAVEQHDRNARKAQASG